MVMMNNMTEYQHTLMYGTMMMMMVVVLNCSQILKFGVRLLISNVIQAYGSELGGAMRSSHASRITCGR